MLSVQDSVVSTAWLGSRLGQRDLRIADATTFLERKPDGSPGYVPRGGQVEFAAGHIPGAGFFDLVRDLADRSSPFPFTMLPLDRLAAAVAAKGVNGDHTIVVYSAGSPMWATRLWWMLRSIGLENVAVLDGGFERWKFEGRPLTTDFTVHLPTTFVVRPVPERWATKEEVRRVVESPGSGCLLDALSPQDYAGERASYGRAGHIPGALNVPFRDLLDPTTGSFKSVPELKRQLTATGAFERERVICYCGGGIASTMLAMALERCGHGNVAVYDGSMIEWSADPTLPLTKGTTP